MKAENREQFKKMFRTFNDPERKLHFIAVVVKNNRFSYD